MLHKIPVWFQKLFSGYTWQIPGAGKVIYLTFDDGPIPEVTEWVVEILAKYGIRASFFVVGENVSKYPEVFRKLVEGRHVIGNHTYHHVRGWGTPTSLYLVEAGLCKDAIMENGGEEPLYFRPPHGRIRPAQAKALRERYKLLMWNVLTVDYDRNLNEEKCLANSIKATHPGSIVVFHDSLKAEKNLKYVLPRYIEHFTSLGYSSEPLP